MIRIEVNGRAYERDVEPRRTLADFLRDDLNLTGTHVACEHGFCGSCNVLVDGEAIRSCLMFAVQADGRSVETVEGISPRPTGRCRSCSRRSRSTTRSSAGSARRRCS